MSSSISWNANEIACPTILYSLWPQRQAYSVTITSKVGSSAAPRRLEQKPV